MARSNAPRAFLFLLLLLLFFFFGYFFPLLFMVSNVGRKKIAKKALCGKFLLNHTTKPNKNGWLILNP